MSYQVTLHSFPGQVQSLSILKLAEFLNFQLDIKLLKKNNIKEKLYKKTLIKRFPLLEYDSNKVIQGTASIMRYIARKSNNENVYNENSHAVNQDEQLMNLLLDELCPAVNVLSCQERDIIEPLKGKEASLVKKDALTAISNVDKILANIETNQILLSDFLMVSLLSSTLDKQVKQQVKKMSNIQKRLNLLQQNESFKKTNANMLRRALQQLNQC